MSLNSSETDDTTSMLEFLCEKEVSQEVLENNDGFLEILSRVNTNELYERTFLEANDNQLPLLPQETVKTELSPDEKGGRLLLNDEDVKIIEEWRKDDRSHFTRGSSKVLEDALLSSSASTSDMSPRTQGTDSRHRKRRHPKINVVLDNKQVKIESKQDIFESSTIKIEKVVSLQKIDTKKKRKPNTFLKEIEKMKTIMMTLDRSCKPQMDELSDLMDISYKFRFNEIYNKGMPIKDWIGKYPALTQYRMVEEEFIRVYAETKDLEELEKKLKVVLSTQINKFRQNLSSFADSFAAKCLEKLDSCEENDTQLLLDTQLACMMHNITNGQGEGEIFLYNNTGLQPRLHVATPNFEINRGLDENPNFLIYTEMDEIAEVQSFYQAVMICYFYYWIFDLAYLPTAKQFFSVFDKLAEK